MTVEISFLSSGWEIDNHSPVKDVELVFEGATRRFIKGKKKLEISCVEPRFGTREGEGRLVFLDDSNGIEETHAEFTPSFRGMRLEDSIRSGGSANLIVNGEMEVKMKHIPPIDR